MRSTHSIDLLIHQLAAPTLCVVHARTLRANGISRQVTARRITWGIMVPMLAQTYAVGPQAAAPTWDMWCMAGLLSAGPGAYLYGPTAGRVTGVWDRADDTIHIAASRTWRIDPPAPLVFHRPVVEQSPDRFVGPMRVAPFADMCRGMARTMTPLQVAFVIRKGVYQQLGTLADLDETVEAFAGSPGVPVLREAVRLVRSGSAGTRSAAEDVLEAGIRERRLSVPVVNTRGVLGLARDEPDFVWLSRALNVEVDGRHHAEPSQQQDDRERDAELAARGVTVYRFWARDVHRRTGRVLRLIAGALRGEPLPLVRGTRRVRL